MNTQFTFQSTQVFIKNKIKKLTFQSTEKYILQFKEKKKGKNIFTKYNIRYT